MVGGVGGLLLDRLRAAGAYEEITFKWSGNTVVMIDPEFTKVALDRLVRPGLLPLATLIARWSRDPARLLNLPGGALTPGAAADVTVLDLDAKTIVDPSRFHSRSRNTPFGGWQLRGAPTMTIVGGKVVRA